MLKASCHKVLYHVVSQQLMKFVLFTSHGIVWQIIYGFVVASLITLSKVDIHVSLRHQLMLAFLMSLIGDQIVFLIPCYFSVSEYIQMTLIEFVTATIILTLMQFGPKFLTKILMSIISNLETLAAASFARLYHRIPSQFENADPKFLFVSALLPSTWMIVIDSISRVLTHARNATRFTGKAGLLLLVASAAISFSLSQKNAISDLVGLYPFDYTGFVMFALLSLAYMAL